MPEIVKKATACLLAVSLSLLSASGAWAGGPRSASGTPGAVPALGLPVASAVVGALDVMLAQPPGSPEMLSLETQAKAAVLLRHVQDQAAPAAAADVAPAPAAVPVEQAERTLARVDEVLRDITWHDLHDPKVAERALRGLTERIPADGEAPPAPERLRSVLERLRAPLQNGVNGHANPWDVIFDAVGSHAAAEAAPAPDVRVARDSSRWREVALYIMTAGSLNLSRTAIVGRKFFAHDLDHDQVKDKATINFLRTAEWMIDNVADLPLSLDTAEQINRMLTEGLVPERLRGNLFFHGNPKFHDEVKLFYRWLESDKGKAFAREHPVEMAERLHFLLSFFDGAPDSNGRTARMMADLALMKAGMAPAFYLDIDDYFTRGSVRSGVSLEQRRRYFREMVDRGQEVMATMQPMRERLDRGHSREETAAATLAPGILEHITGTPGHDGAPIEPETRGSAIEYLRLAHLPALNGHVAAAAAGAKEGAAAAGFPGSFRRMLLGISLLEGVSIAMAATMAVYGIKQFGLLYAVIATSLSILTRIPGSWVAAKIKGALDARGIYVASTVVNALQILALPVGLFLFGPGTMGYLAVFMASQAVYGFLWGATFGMAENTIVPKVVGQDRATLERAKLSLMASKTLAALAFAFVVGPVLTFAIGVTPAILVYAGLVLATLPLFLGIRYAPETGAAGPAASANGKPKKEGLTLAEAAPYMATMLMVFTFYTVFVGNFATFMFDPERATFLSLMTIGFYNAGGAVISMSGVLPRLIASWRGRELPPAPPAAKDTSALKKWFGALVLAAAFYLATGLLGLTWLNVTLGAALLGVAIAVNRSQWMAYYMSAVDKAHHEKVASRLNGWPTAASFLPFAILSAGQLLGLPVFPFLLATGIVVAAALAAAWAFSRRQ